MSEGGREVRGVVGGRVARERKQRKKKGKKKGVRRCLNYSSVLLALLITSP